MPKKVEVPQGLTLLYTKGFNLKEIAKKNNVSKSLIYKMLKNNTQMREKAVALSLSKIDKKKWKFEDNQWSPILSKNLFYLLGILKGDGCVCPTKYKTSTYYGIYLVVIDRKFIEEFIQSLKKIGLAHSGKIYQSSNLFKTKISSKIFVDWYKMIDITWIEKYANKEEYKLAFIKGFYESEGCLLYTKYIEMTNINKDLIKVIKDFLNFFNYHPTLRIRKDKKNKIYKIGMYRYKEVEHLLKRITPCIKRKAL